MGSVPYAELYATDLLLSEQVPPFASKLTVYAFALQ